MRPINGISPKDRILNFLLKEGPKTFNAIWRSECVRIRNPTRLSGFLKELQKESLIEHTGTFYEMTTKLNKDLYYRQISDFLKSDSKETIELFPPDVGVILHDKFPEVKTPFAEFQSNSPTAQEMTVKAFNLSEWLRGMWIESCLEAADVSKDFIREYVTRLGEYYMLQEIGKEEWSREDFLKQQSGKGFYVTWFSLPIPKLPLKKGELHEKEIDYLPEPFRLAALDEVEQGLKKHMQERRQKDISDQGLSPYDQRVQSCKSYLYEAENKKKYARFLQVLNRRAVYIIEISGFSMTRRLPVGHWLPD